MLMFAPEGKAAMIFFYLVLFLSFFCFFTRIFCFQGTFEADEDRVVRIKFYQFYGFGQFPKAVVFDKVDIVGNTIHPFYR